MARCKLTRIQRCKMTAPPRWKMFPLPISNYKIWILINENECVIKRPSLLTNKEMRGCSTHHGNEENDLPKSPWTSQNAQAVTKHTSQWVVLIFRMCACLQPKKTWDGPRLVSKLWLKLLIDPTRLDGFVFCFKEWRNLWIHQFAMVMGSNEPKPKKGELTQHVLTATGNYRLIVGVMRTSAKVKLEYRCTHKVCQLSVWNTLF